MKITKLLEVRFLCFHQMFPREQLGKGNGRESGRLRGERHTECEGLEQ